MINPIAWFPPIAAIIGMAAAILVDVGLARLGVNRLVAYAASFMFGVIASVLVLVDAVAWRGAAIDRFDVASTLILYGAWWYIFFLHFVQAFDSSLRVRLLVMLYEAGGRLPRAEVRRRLNDRRLLEVRLDRLVKDGYVVERGGHFFVVSTQIKALALFFRLLKVVLIGQRSEFSARPR
ncbi:MAG TPA: hypothetical protein VMF32_13645 [Xanthobacteraceae bacterium]|nr:hypothetical protein [Xanthobacteraceae bacterium]